MVFRPLELAWGMQKGFTFFTFNWDDGAMNPFLALVWDEELSILYFGFLFVGWNIEIDVEDL